jgi:solute carrier family 35 (UDP-sugar transporter), member A1/2/3
MILKDLCSIKYGALALLVLQNTLLIVMMRYSRKVTGPLYASSTAVFMMEVVKFLTCHIVVLFDQDSFSSYFKQLAEEITLTEILRVSVPSLLYTVQNNLLYFALTHLDAATYQVCYQVGCPSFLFSALTDLAQTKILTTALFSVLLLKKKLSLLQ